MLLDEIDDLKEVIDNLKQEIGAIKDSTDLQIENLTAQCERIKDKTDAEWKLRLKAADRETREKSDLIMLVGKREKMDREVRELLEVP